jgi:DNA-binding beta-propeller fold protein YncE
VLCTAGVSSIAGGGTTSIDGVGTAIRLVSPYGVSVAPNGLFAIIADSSNIRRLELSSGLVSTIAGSTSSPPSTGFADGVGTNARFSDTRVVCVSPNNLFALIADTNNNCIRRLNIASGFVSTLAGSTLSAVGTTDATGTFSSFNKPYGIAFSNNGSFALVADAMNARIRRIDLSTNVVTTFAGWSSGSNIDGIGTFAKFGNPYGVAIDPSSSFCLVTDNSNNVIRKIDLATRAVSMLAGSTSAISMQNTGSNDGIGTFATFYSPKGIAIDPLGTFALVCDSGNNRIRRIEIQSGVVSTLTGSATGGLLDGTLSAAMFTSPAGVALTPDGSFALVAENGNNRVRRITLPTICTGGYYCPSGSSSGTPFICDAGYYCPAGTSAASAKIACNGGYYCPAGSSSATQKICNSGSYCPAGSSSLAAAATCNAGFYCPAGSSSSTQSPCKSGYYCPAGSSTSILVCDAGYYCPTGSSSSTQVLLQPQSDQITAYNPITSTNAVNQDSILGSMILFGVCFGPFVLLIIVVGVGFEKYPNVKQFISTNISEKYCLSFQWSTLDLFFSDIHFRHTGKPISIRQTTFGATMSLATIVSIIGVGCILGFNSIKFPSYSSTISPQPPPWQPAGVYQLIVTVYGAGIDSCATNGFGIVSSASDWSVSPTPVPNVFNPADGSCQLTWRCEGQCKMIASSYALFQLNSPAGAWATFVKYQISTPMFATSSAGSAMDFGSKPYTLSGGFYPPPSGSGPNSNVTAFRGFSPTIVSLTLTPTVINSSAVTTSSVTFEPSLIGVTPGSTVQWGALSAPSNEAFMIHFQLNLNALSFV